MRPTVQQVFETIMSNDYNGYPIVNDDRRLIGLISRHFLIVLLKKKCWRDRSQITPRSEGTASQRNSDVSQDRIIDSDERNPQKQTSAAVFNIQQDNESPSVKEEKKQKSNEKSKNKKRVYHNLEEEAYDTSFATEPSFMSLEDTYNLDWNDFSVNFYSTLPEID